MRTYPFTSAPFLPGLAAKSAARRFMPSRHHGHRGTVRFARVKPRPPYVPPRRDPPEEAAIEHRIVWAKATASEFETWAERESDPEKKARLLRLADKHARDAEALILERNARGVQTEFLPEPVQ